MSFCAGVHLETQMSSSKSLRKGFRRASVALLRMSRAEVDKLFGCGRRRPLERFVITQPDGKQRVIDNVRRTGHDAHIQMLETIHTVRPLALTSLQAVLGMFSMLSSILRPADTS